MFVADTNTSPAAATAAATVLFFVSTKSDNLLGQLASESRCEWMRS